MARKKTEPVSLSSSQKRRKSSRRIPPAGSPPNAEFLLCELKTHQIELEMQNEELRRVQAALEASRDRYADLYDFAPTGYFTLNEKGLIVEINLKGAEQLGIPRRHLLQKPFFIYVDKADRPAFWSYWRTAFNEGEDKAGQLLLKRKDGSTFPARIERRIADDPALGRVCRLAVIDVSDLKRAEEILRESEQKYRLLFESNPHPTWVYDPKTLAFLDVNQAAVEHYGYSREEFLRMTLRQIRPPGDIPMLVKKLTSIAPGLNRMGRWKHRKKDGALIDVEIVAQTVYFSGRAAVLVVVTDITDRKRAEEAIQSMNEALREKNVSIEEASRTRNRFFSYMSHELKTPVNSIVGFTQLLGSGTYGPLTPEQAGTVGRIHSNARDLIHLINNILDLAKLESGKMALQATEVNLVDLIEKVLINFEPQLQEKKLLLKKEIDPAVPERFWTDPLQLRSILTNLVSNAVKFTGRGEVRLRLRRSLDGKGVFLSVEDTGIGIQPASLGRIFEEFEQEGSSDAGTGLGLAIVRRMVDFLGGKIDVSSSPGVGTTLTLFLPEHSPDRPLRERSPT